MTDSPPPQVVQLPQQQQTSGSSEVRPYAPVEPFLKELLPNIQREFSQAPVLFDQSLVPTDSAQTLAAREAYADLAGQAGAYAPVFQQLAASDIARASADPSSDPIFLAESEALADRARRLTERDEALAKTQAIQAGQFGLGSTALSELQANQQQLREETIRKNLVDSLGRAEARRIAAQGRIPGTMGTQLSAARSQAGLTEAIGQDVERREAARLADQARLVQQPQQARREQIINLANLLGGLAGLGTSTTHQTQSSGFTSKAFHGGPSPLMQFGSLLGAGAGLARAIPTGGGGGPQ